MCPCVTPPRREDLPGRPVHAGLTSGAGLPVSEVLQLEDVHGLGVAGGTEELRVHAEHERADGHVPGNTAMQRQTSEPER